MGFGLLFFPLPKGIVLQGEVAKVEAWEEDACYTKRSRAVPVRNAKMHAVFWPESPNCCTVRRTPGVLLLYVVHGNAVGGGDQ